MEFLSLVNQWSKIQQHSVSPIMVNSCLTIYQKIKKFSIEEHQFGKQRHNMIYLLPKHKMYLALSDAEIMFNSQDDLHAIYEEWVKVQIQVCLNLSPLKLAEVTLKS